MSKGPRGPPAHTCPGLCYDKDGANTERVLVPGLVLLSRIVQMKPIFSQDIVWLGGFLAYNGGTSTGHGIGQTCYYDVITYVFVAKRRDLEILGSSPGECLSIGSPEMQFRAI